MFDRGSFLPQLVRLSYEWKDLSCDALAVGGKCRHLYLLCLCLCRVLLGLQAEMVPLALQDSQGVLELLAPPESASHVPV